MSTFVIVRHELIKRKRSRHKKRVFQTPVVDGFSLSNSYFKTIFRVSKKTAKIVLDALRPDIEPRSGIKTAVSAETKVLCALRYFASGCLQRELGQELLLHLSQAAVSRAIVAVSDGICKYLSDFVHFPDPNEYEETSKAFYDKGGFPNVIGATGCMHIVIATPPDNDPVRPKHGFRNPKGFYSLNVLFVCDSNMKITYVNPEYPGASMDWFVWRHSHLRAILEDRKGDRTSNYWLLGGCSFQPEPWLLTPIEQPVSDAEKAYNSFHEETRKVLIETTRRLKQRFGCLRNGIRHNADVSESVVKACVILHNMSLNDDDEDLFQENEDRGELDYYTTVNDLIESKKPYVPVDNFTNETALLHRHTVLESFFS